MPPDISTGPTALAAGTPTRASGLTASGPPVGDPLAALFASLLANSDGPTPTTGPVSALVRAAPAPGGPSQSAAPLQPDAVPAQDKTPDGTPSAGSPTPPPPRVPIQRRPFLPPNVGVTAEQKTTGQKTEKKTPEKTAPEKTMDTSPTSALPAKDKADITGGELPLPGVGVNTSAAPVPFPALLISVQSPPALPGQIAVAPSLPTAVPTLPQAAPAALPGVPAPVSLGVPAPVSLGVPAPVSLGVPAPAALPGAFTLGASAAPSAGPNGVLPLPTQAAGIPSPQALPVAVDLTNLPQAVQAVAVQGTAAPVNAKAVPSGTPAAPPSLVLQGVKPADVSIVTEEQTITDGKAATDGRPAMDGKVAREGSVTAGNLSAVDGRVARDGGVMKDSLPAKEGGTATDGKSATDGGPATDSRAATEGGTATEGQKLTAGEAPKTGLKSAAPPADTNTRVQAVPTKAQAAELQAPTVDKPPERSAQNATGDAPLPVPTPLPAQAGMTGVEVKPLSAADRADVVRQVADAVSAMPLPAKTGASEQMTLQLHPKEWGQLQVSVTVTPGATPEAAQAVTAHVVAQNPQVKAALENQSGDLRQALREAGLHLDKISVTVQRMEASAQGGTATSGGRHEASHGGAGQGMGGTFGGTTPDQKTGMFGGTGTLEAARMSDGTGMSGAAGNGMSFTASGGSQGGRQGGQPPAAYAAAYSAAEPEDAAPIHSSRRPATSQIDMRA